MERITTLPAPSATRKARTAPKFALSVAGPGPTIPGTTAHRTAARTLQPWGTTVVAFGVAGKCSPLDPLSFSLGGSGSHSAHLLHPAELFSRNIIGRLMSGSVDPARLSLYSRSPCSD